MSSTVGLQGLWEKSANPVWQHYWRAEGAQPEPAGGVDGMGWHGVEGRGFVDYFDYFKAVTGSGRLITSTCGF